MLKNLCDNAYSKDDIWHAYTIILSIDVNLVLLILKRVKKKL